MGRSMARSRDRPCELKCVLLHFSDSGRASSGPGLGISRPGLAETESESIWVAGERFMPLTRWTFSHQNPPEASPDPQEASQDPQEDPQEGFEKIKIFQKNLRFRGPQRSRRQPPPLRGGWRLAAPSKTRRCTVKPCQTVWKGRPCGKGDSCRPPRE